MLALVCALWVCSGHSAYGQSGGRELAIRLTPNVVQIRTRWGGRPQKSGFGIIIGERDKFLYVVTANHVVRGNTPGEFDATPTVYFSRFQGAPYPSELLETSSPAADLAVIRINTTKAPLVTWTREVLSAENTSANALSATNIWFIGLEQRWFVPPKPGKVSDVREVIRNEYSGSTIIVDGLNITEGTSGAPLLSDDGIVGMIVSVSNTQQVETIPIERIEAIIKGWEQPWQLTIISPKQNCDKLAASPYDIDRPSDVVGVDFGDIDAEKAITACLSTFVKYSEKIPRFIFELARASEAAKRLDAAELGYKAAADKGYAAAESSLGRIYERQNKEGEAAELYRLAGDQGDPVGQTNLGTMLRDGYGGLAKDDIAAVSLFRIAASRDYPPALSALAWMYEQGRGGLSKNETEVERLYRLAAAKGEPYAQRALMRLGF
jgi:hypothetical protein